jgi:hypothetical protein
MIVTPVSSADSSRLVSFRPSWERSLPEARLAWVEAGPVLSRARLQVAWLEVEPAWFQVWLAWVEVAQAVFAAQRAAAGQAWLAAALASLEPRALA